VRGKERDCVLYVCEREEKLKKCECLCVRERERESV